MTLFEVWRELEQEASKISSITRGNSPISNEETHDIYFSVESMMNDRHVFRYVATIWMKQNDVEEYIHE